MCGALINHEQRKSYRSVVMKNRSIINTKNIVRNVKKALYVCVLVYFVQCLFCVDDTSVVYLQYFVISICSFEVLIQIFLLWFTVMCLKKGSFSLCIILLLESSVEGRIYTHTDEEHLCYWVKTSSMFVNLSYMVLENCCCNCVTLSFSKNVIASFLFSS